AAQKLVQRRVVELAPEVVNGDLDGGLGAGVFLHRALDQAYQVVEVGDVATDQQRRDVVPDGVDDRAVRVAGDGGGGGSLAVADVAGIGVHLDDDVLDLVHRAQRRLERRLQRHAQHRVADFRDFHGSVIPGSGFSVRGTDVHDAGHDIDKGRVP